jgi:hypothetical protein
MATGYTRNDTTNNIANGNIIDAADLDGEFDAIQAAYDATTGHAHDGTVGGGAPIEVLGPTQDIVVTNTVLRPKTDNTVDLGSNTLEFKDLWIDGTANIDSLVADTADINGGTIDGVTIGGASAGAVTTTSLVATTADINGGTIDGVTIGGASAGAVTTTSLVATTADINGGTIDGATIATSDITVGSGKTLNVSSGTLTLADNQISGDKVEGGTINAITINTLGSTTGNITNVNATTIDTTNLEVTTIKAKDGTAAATIADSTGVITVASSVLTTTDINGGTVDGTTIGGSSAAAGTFTTTTATTGNITTVNATTVDTTNLEVTAIKAKDGTAAATIADSTGVVTVASSVLTTTDINGGTIDGVTIGGASAGAITGTTITATGDVTIPDKIIHAGDTNTSIRFPAADTVTVETDGAERLRVTSAGNVGIGTNAPGEKVVIEGATPFLLINNTDESKSGVRFADAQNIGERFQAVYDAGAAAFTLDRVESTGVITERMRIDSAGNVGIGTTSPSSKLHVLSDVTTTDAGLIRHAASQDAANYYSLVGTRFQFDKSFVINNKGDEIVTYSQNSTLGLNLLGGSANLIRLTTNSAERLRVTSAGNVGIGTTSPTATLHVNGTVAGTFLADKATAEAGTSSTTLMTPQRTAEAIDAQAGALPTASTGTGQWSSLNSAVGAAAVLSAGGTWAYAIYRFNSGVVATSAFGVAAGGTTVGAAAAGQNWSGFAWRVQ